MSFLIGVVLFALGIALTIGLHEFGHMRAALASGMVVRRFYVGFGPTLFSFRGKTGDPQRGSGAGIEYGFKAIPLGGFCDIAGMTAQDEVTSAEQPYAMVDKAWYKRVFVLLGGILMNIAIAVVLIYSVALTSGLPNPHADMRPVIASTACVEPAPETPCTGAGPAADAGLQAGDMVLAVDGQPMENFMQLRDYLMAHPGQQVAVEVQRGDTKLQLSIPVAVAKRADAEGNLHTIGAIGIRAQRPADLIKTYGPVSGIGATAQFTGTMLDGTLRGLAAFPAKIPGVAASIFGAQRDEESPVSVVGASRIGGELAERNQWASFVMLMASLNLFLALFNLLPFPPLDGGHIAVVFYEMLRDALRRLRGLAPAGPADYTRLMPLTIAMSVLLLLVGLVTIVADVVNPIRLL